MIIELLKIIPHTLKRKAYLVIILSVLATIVDLIGVASIMPLVELVQQADIPENDVYKFMYSIFGDLSTNRFKIIFAFISMGFIVSGISLKASLVHFQYKLAHIIEAYLSSLLFKKYLRYDFFWFKRNHTSNLSKNILNEVSYVIAESFLPLLKLITEVIFIIFLSSFLIFINWKVTLMLFTMFLLAYCLIYGFSKAKIVKYGRLRLNLNERRFKSLEEYISVIRDIKIFHKEKFFVKQFRNIAYQYSSAHAVSKTLTFLPKFIMEGLVFITVVLFLLGFIILDIEILKYVPLITLYLMALYKFLPSVQQVIISSAKLKNSLPSVMELNAVIEGSNSEVVEENVTKTFSILELKLRNIRFSFDEKPLFDGLNAYLGGRGFVALLGPSGSGKSTLLDIICGMTEQESGAIYNNEASIKRLYLKTSLAYVSQNVVLLDANFYENVAFGIPIEEIDKVKVQRICENLQLNGWIMDSFKDGYDTNVGQNGSRISGGQKQRIGLARALYVEPRVLVLDEGTSALNVSLEASILDIIKVLSREVFVLFSSHSLDILKYADRILYLNDGVLQEFSSVEKFETSKSYEEYVSRIS